ncbi:hypothetical protein [Schlesneria paludicola]|uniref:hypothetical protein n=1 Tax=Schlesneria paludicola TaxID=360056 RepID=UPI00029A3CB5|nr:hypothetical protein [Schlesneria paludicola]
MTQSKDQHAQSLDFGASYPTRDPFFANDFVRDIEREALAVELGPAACWLLTVIVLTEDKARYRRAPWFRQSVLIERVGLQKDALRDTVRKCVEKGWLHWEQKNNFSPIYAWVTYPSWFEHKQTWTEKPLKSRSSTSQEPSKSRSKAAEEPPESRSVDAQEPLSTIPIPVPIPEPKSKPSPTPKDDWQAVGEAMLEIGIGETSEPLRSLKDNQVDPGLVLGVLRYASESKLWKAGKIRRRLINLRPGQSPDDRRFWMQPDHGPVHPATSTSKSSDDSRTRDRRLRQLELEFGPELNELTTAAMIDRYRFPDHVRDRLRAYPTWKHTDRAPEVRRIVLEFLHTVRSNESTS